METRDCFDPRLAEFATRTLPLAAVVDPLSVTHAPEVVERYREAMRGGARFPPISVIRLGGRVFVADGHKRFSAYRQLGARDIVVEVWPLRRWLRDQFGQLARSTRNQGSLLGRALYDRAARRAARREWVALRGHWRRIFMSARAWRTR